MTFLCSHTNNLVVTLSHFRLKFPLAANLCSFDFMQLFYCASLDPPFISLHFASEDSVKLCMLVHDALFMLEIAAYL